MSLKWEKRGKCLKKIARVCVALGLVMSAGNTYAESVRALNNSGVEAYKQGKTEKALEHFRQAKSNDPENLVLDYNLGVAQATQGEVEGAFQNLSRAALARDPQVAARAAYSEGVLAYQEAQKKLEAQDLQGALKMAERAVSANREALRKNPLDTDARVNYELARGLHKQIQEQMQNQQQKEQESDKQNQQNQDKQNQEQKKQNQDKQDQNKQEPDKQENRDNQDPQKSEKDDSSRQEQQEQQKNQEQSPQNKQEQQQNPDRQEQQNAQQEQQPQNQTENPNPQENQNQQPEQEKSESERQDARKQPISQSQPEPEKSGEKQPQTAQEGQGKESEPQQDATLNILNLLSDNDTQALKRALKRRQALQVQRPEKDW